MISIKSDAKTTAEHRAGRTEEAQTLLSKIMKKINSKGTQLDYLLIFD